MDIRAVPLGPHASQPRYKNLGCFDKERKEGTMAFFNAPTAFFVGNTNPKEKRFEKNLLKAARRAGYDKFIEPCSGELAMSQLAIEAGFQYIEASDITLFSTLLGYYVEERPIDELCVYVDGIGRCNDIVDVLYYQLLFRTEKMQGRDYYDNIITDIRERKEWHKQKIKESLDKAAAIFRGKVHYFPMDMVEHLKKFIDDEKAIIIMNFPTYKGGYEKHFDVGNRITWKEPPYQMFDPECDKPKIKDMLKDAKCLVMFYEETYPNETCFDAVYVRFGARDGMNTYITTNNKSKVIELVGEECAVRLDDKEMRPIKKPLIYADYVFTEESKIEVVEALPCECDYYRKLFTHNFSGSSGAGGFAVLVDDMLLGVFGYSKCFSAFFGNGENEDLFLTFAMAKPVKGFRVSRLLTYVAKVKSIAYRVCNDLDRFTYKNLKTAMISKYPESKQMRGLMKLTGKAFDKKIGMYRLEYTTSLSDRTVKEEYLEWLKKETAYKKLQK